MIEYQKLVRDRIPQIIQNSGYIPVTRVLDDEEYLECLEKKLDEEVAEFHRDNNTEELADVLEVVYALAEVNGYSPEQLNRICAEKRAERGAFHDRIFLIGKETP